MQSVLSDLTLSGTIAQPNKPKLYKSHRFVCCIAVKTVKNKESKVATYLQALIKC